MIRNYNVLSGSRDTRLKNDVRESVGSPPSNSKKNRGTYWLVCSLLFLSAFVGQNMFAQASSYGFAASTGATLDPMVGATIIGAAPNDDTPYAASNIGFSFVFESTPFTQFSASPDGFIRLGATTASSQFTNVITSTTNIPKLAAFWDDVALGSAAGGGYVKVLTTGVAGSQICKIEWFVTSPRNLSGPANSVFQMWLYETTNVIEFRYGTVGNSGSASVGIVGSPVTFHSVTISSNTSSTTTGNDTNPSAPASGTMYKFTPPSPCTGTPVAGTIPAATPTCNATATAISITGYPTGVSGIAFAWEESDDNGVADAWAPAVGGTGATSATYTTPGLSGTIYYRAKVTCGASGLFSYTNATMVTIVICTYDVSLGSAAYSSIMATGTNYTWQGTSGDDNTTTTNLLTGTTFRYAGNLVTGFQACTNGWMTFNTANTSTAWSNGLTATTPNRVLAPFWEDLVLTGQNFTNANNCMKYRVIGTLGSGSAVIVIEWAGMERFNIPGPNLNFQVRLYEAGNIIEYVYGTFEGFDGSVVDTYSYSVGFNGANPAGTSPTDRFGMQTGFTNHFAASDPANLNVMPSCNSKLTFTPGIYSGPVSTPTIPAPVNDNSAGAVLVDVNAAPCVSLCSTYYTSRSATNSGAGQACSLTAGNEDDDVWFKFETTAAADYLIRLRSSPGYNGVLELLNSSFVSIACVNATGSGLIETINATGLIVDGETYYIRVFHDGTGIGTSSGQFSICVSEVILPPTNDNIAGAISVTHAATCVPTNSVLPSTLAATLSPQPVCGGNADDDVWYAITTVTEEITITVQSGAGYNAHVEVFTSDNNTATGVLTSVGCFNATSTGGSEVIEGTGIPVGTVLFVRVYHSGSGAGTGNFSICATFPPAPVCATNESPVNGATAVTACPSLTLSWDAVALATSYDVYFNAGAVATTLVSNQPGTSYTVSALGYSTGYAWKIVPKNGTGSAVGCISYTFTTAAQAATAVSPSSPTVTCGGTPVMLNVIAGGGPVNPIPTGECLQNGNGQWPGGTYTAANCDGNTVNLITTVGYAGEYSRVQVTPSYIYEFTSSGTGDSVTITSADGLITYAYGLSPLTWYNDVSATEIRFHSQKDDCLTDSVSRNREFVCAPAPPTATFTPTTGLFLDAAGTIPYAGGDINTVYALPASTQAYVLTSSNACLSSGSVTVTVGPCASTINLKLFVEGYYIGGGAMTPVKFNQDQVSPLTDVETISVELHSASSPYGVIDTTTAMLKTDGTAVATFGSAPTGSFYISVSGVNAIKTWSKLPQTVGGTTSYDFSTAVTQSYGDNMKNIGGVYTLYSGDINLDGSIDGSDAPDLFDDVDNSAFGVQNTDLNGDGSVDNSDVPLFLDNADLSIYSHDPNNP